LEVEYLKLCSDEPDKVRLPSQAVITFPYFSDLMKWLKGTKNPE
jgi:hypothetical protein